MRGHDGCSADILGSVAILDLAPATFTAHLTDGFRMKRPSLHVAFAGMTTRRVNRQRPVIGTAVVSDIGPPLASRRYTKSFKGKDRDWREIVVVLKTVHILRGKA